jgi:spore maturation protein CgeB
VLEAAVLELRAVRGRPSSSGTSTHPRRSSACERPGDPFRALVPRYDLMLTYGGGDPVVHAYRALGARACVPIYNALDPGDAPSRSPPDRASRRTWHSSATACPTGRRASRRSSWARPRRCPERRFLLGGNGWDDKPMPPNVRDIGHVYTRDHNAFNGTPLAVLNVAATAWPGTASRPRRGCSRPRARRPA